MTPLERERVRATLVLGLIAAILGLRLWEHALPEPFAWVPTASGVLLLYWSLYVGAAAYGVSEDLFGRGFCGWALWFAHQSFKFAIVVTAIMVAWILMPFVRIAWSYQVAAILTSVTLALSELRYFLIESDDRIADARRRSSAWAVLAILVLLLFLLGYVH